MYQKKVIKPPFFEIGPKSYLYGSQILDLARIADEASRRHRVQVIFTTPFPDIRMVAQATQDLIVFAPHMDPIRPGRGLADILPESVREAGADGVMLNHTEKPITYVTLYQTMKRVNELNMLSLIITDSVLEAKAAALLSPDIITAEPAELIATGQASDMTTSKLNRSDSFGQSDIIIDCAGISRQMCTRIVKGHASFSSAIALPENRSTGQRNLLRPAKLDERQSK